MQNAFPNLYVFEFLLCLHFQVFNWQLMMVQTCPAGAPQLKTETVFELEFTDTSAKRLIWRMTQPSPPTRAAAWHPPPPPPLEWMWQYCQLIAHSRQSRPLSSPILVFVAHKVISLNIGIIIGLHFGREQKTRVRIAWSIWIPVL